VTRRLADWVSAFHEHTNYITSPSIFRKWGAISCIAGALERKVWVESQGERKYPNLYTILVGPPGVGKSAITSRIQKLWSELPEHHMSPSNTTKAALIDALGDAERVVMRPKEAEPIVKFNSLKILSNELGVLLPAYEGEFMSTLTDIYDGTPYEERRRSSKTGPLVIERPQFNMLAATTPAHLNDFLPAGAFDQGFLSRCFLAYSGEIILRPLFETAVVNKEEWRNLVLDLKHIAKMYGPMMFTAESAAAITAWHMGGGRPKPQHPKLHNYNTRRTIHLLKLCIVASASSSDDMLIELDHYHTAMNWLMELETAMPDIFKSMSSGGDAKAIEECWYFCFQMFSRKGDPVPEAKLYQFLQERVPAHSVERILDVMVRGGLLKKIDVNKVGPCYTPREKHKVD
jgi:hypothetical protein